MRVYSTEKDQLTAILSRSYSETADVSAVVTKIIERVQKDGDQALYQLIEEIDQVSLSSLAVTEAEIMRAEDGAIS